MEKSTAAQPTSKKRKYVKLRKIWRNKMLTRAFNYISVVLVSLAAQGSASGPNKDSGDSERKIDRSELHADVMKKAMVSPEVDVQTEIDKRVDWFVTEYVETLKAKQAELKAMSYSKKLNYIKKNFFDRVFEAGRLVKGSNYCVAAAMGCLLDLNERTGDLDNFFPDGSTNAGSAMVSCPDLVKYVQKNYKNCIKEYIYGSGSKLKTKSGEVYDPEGLTEGMVLVQESEVNTSSGWHTVVYIGNGQVLSFNNDRIYNLNKSKRTKVIDLPEIIRQEWKERVKEMPKENQEEMIAMLSELYIGREDDFLKTLQADNLKLGNELFQFNPVANKTLFQSVGGKDVVDLSPKKVNKNEDFNAWTIFARMAGKSLDS